MTPDQLRAALDELGLTRAELSRLCGVEVRAVYRWLRGEIKPVPHYAVTIIDQERKIRQLRALLSEYQAAA